MKPSTYYDRLVDVMEEPVKFTVIVPDRSDHLTIRCSERVEVVPELVSTLAAVAISHEANQDEKKDELE